ncbi:MAG: dihydrofolate reductase [Limnochordia bacterium]|nr:dihydrofolate reductase [Bacillota bacterium]NLH31882.1 dihydrofolate reductase [Bacillota bacterium]HOB08935.1 dihydrofolate reductase [Limnochordia bacterium]HPZ31093.1 dihydrofolate reductase [Limnochordia bacterium]HQD70694.1 dihydrofolate reductase [Limnochordia bacterium]
MLAIIAAVGRNRELGKDNRMPWHLPNDLRRFRQITSGHTVIMGRKTFASLPKLLPKRRHIILTRDEGYRVDQPGVEIAHSIPELFSLLDPHETNFVIGGGEIYRQLLPYCDMLYLTVIDGDFEADTYFPDFDRAEWQLIESEQGITDPANPWPHRYEVYKRISD